MGGISRYDVLRCEPPTDVCIKIFLGPGDPCEHLFTWMEKWCGHTIKEWVHLFIHALGPIPAAWYLDVELHQRTRQWTTLRDKFLGTFGLTGGFEVLEGDLQTLDTVAIGESSPNVVRGGPTWETQIQDNVELHKAIMEDCDADPCKVLIIASGEERTVVGPSIHEVASTKPLKPRSVNFNMTVPPKRVTIGNCWDEGTIGNMIELIMGYPDKCSGPKQVTGSLGGTHFTLNSDAWLEEQ